jgi:hypothetical protein
MDNHLVMMGVLFILMIKKSYRGGEFAGYTSLQTGIHQ